MAVENLIHHGEHPFLSSVWSECQRKFVDPIVRGFEGRFDQLQSMGVIEGVP
jgi:hypothetical protein